ncbi:MAG TPA: nucleoside-diphosphate kinase [Candidatus Wolfebacteria bacterium]|nr:nucleoside-diphosphate kinase [Candidatus Wolfebacteria bacterium]
MKTEKTFIIIKPDGVQRSLIGEIIQRLERTGLKLVAVKMIVPDENFIEKHYTIDPEWKGTVGEKTIKSYREKGLKPPYDDPHKVGNIVLGNLKKFMTSGPVIAMVLQGLHAVKLVRKLVGGTEPFASDVGTIRGDFVLDSYQLADIDGRAIRNLVHASGSIEEANKEIALWFKPEEIINYRLIQERILYDVNLDEILE